MNNRTKVIESAECLAGLLADKEVGLASWHIACERVYQTLLHAAAEESPIVKAARVLIRARVLDGIPGAVRPTDVDLLEAQIAAAGDPPYAASTEDDSWVERIRSELRERA